MCNARRVRCRSTKASLPSPSPVLCIWAAQLAADGTSLSCHTLQAHARTHTYLPRYIHTYAYSVSNRDDHSVPKQALSDTNASSGAPQMSLPRPAWPAWSLFPPSSPSLSPVSQASLVCIVCPPAVINSRCSCVRVDQTAESAASTVRLSYFPRHGHTEGGSEKWERQAAAALFLPLSLYAQKPSGSGSGSGLLSRRSVLVSPPPTARGRGSGLGRPPPVPCSALSARGRALRAVRPDGAS